MEPPPSPSTDPGPDTGGHVAARARSFDAVADAYDRARPSYPPKAVEWLVGRGPGRVLELGAGTGKLTEQVAASGHDVVASDPSPTMLRRLGVRVPTARRLAAGAEAIPLAAHSVDVVVAAQAFHWFEADATLPEIARVLRPGGVLALVWNVRDERIPWVRRIGALIGSPEHVPDPVPTLDDTGLFESVERSTYRFWQPQTRQSLRDLVASLSGTAVMQDAERRRVLAEVDELYDGYGRGHDGMLLPYTTYCFRTRVLPWASPRPRTPGAPPAPEGPDDLGTDALLIDFR